MKVKPGTIVVIDGVAYQFGSSSARVYNKIVDFLGEGIDPSIHLWVKNQRCKNGDSFLVSKIKEAMERQEWNKASHGL